jgi:hypothetical protein
MNVSPRKPKPASSREGANPPLNVEVAWADITKVSDTDILMSGAYMGVPAIGSLEALDGLISVGGSQKPVLASLIGRGALRCSVGDIHFFPCPDTRQLLVVGMGRQGFFSRGQLVRAARCAAEAIGGLQARSRVSTILIGTGAGNLEVWQSVDGLQEGFVQAMQADAGLSFEHLRLVEFRLDRAFGIVDVLAELAQSAPYRKQIAIAPDLVEPERGGGSVPVRFGYAMMLGEVARAWVEPDNPLHDSALTLCGLLPAVAQEAVRKELGTYAKQDDRRRDGMKFRLGYEHVEDRTRPDRLTFSQDGHQIRTAAMTNLATVTERVLAMKFGWIDRIIGDLYDPRNSPDLAPIDERCRNAYGNLIHPDVREKVSDTTALVIEVDRGLAGVPWEMLRENGADRDPLGVRRPVARQLRTIYSPRVTLSEGPAACRALVIGDPDDTLLGAATEAAKVYALLVAKGFDVDLCIRPANALGKGSYKVESGGKEVAAEPADLFRVLQRLQRTPYRIVHYAGHAIFSPAAPERSGWRFAEDEVLTAAMLENTESAPALIFANACLSSRVAARSRVDESRLVASLADEFMRRGVEDYIGCAWYIPDEHALDFAVTFYTAALSGKQLGVALQEARAALYQKVQSGDAVGAWAAYQHYGDPCRTLPHPERSPEKSDSPGARSG